MFKIKNLKRAVAAAMAAAMVLLITGCGNEPEQEVPDIAESVENGTLDEAAETEVAEEAEEVKEEAEEEPAEPLTYVEENGLEYTEATIVNTHGKLMDADNRSDYIIGDVTFQLGSLSIEDAEEEGFKTVIVDQVLSGYRWTDGENYKTYVSFPTLFVVDSYTGIIVPNETIAYDAVTGVHRAEVEWDGKTYPISYYETTEWIDSNRWDKVEGGDYIWNCGAVDTLTITIPDDYDGLALFLPSILNTKEYTESGEHIMDYWSDEDCYLFKVYIDDEENVEDESPATTSTTDSKTDKTETSESAPASTATPKQEGTKPQTQNEQPKPAHTHSYTESVTANPTCSSKGTKTFTCSCGDSYTESIPATGHQWETHTETVHHESMGHMESTPHEVTTFHCRGCGGSFNSVDEFYSHDGGGCGGSSYYWTTETTYDNQWVVDTPEYDETVTISKCSVCGATQ